MINFILNNKQHFDILENNKTLIIIYIFCNLKIFIFMQDSRFKNLY